MSATPLEHPARHLQPAAPMVRAIVWVLVCGSMVACGNRSEDAATKPAADAAAATSAFIDAEAAWQKTVNDGPATAFVAAAKTLHVRCEALERALDTATTHLAWRQLAADRGVLDGVLADDPARYDQMPLRRAVAQTVHERTTTLALDALPYPADPALSKRTAALVEAESLPHGGIDEAIGVLTADHDRICACTDRACVAPLIDELSRHMATYDDVSGSAAKEQQLTTLENDALACFQRAHG
jgi:hypothetical protein